MTRAVNKRIDQRDTLGGVHTGPEKRRKNRIFSLKREELQDSEDPKK